MDKDKVAAASKELKDAQQEYAEFTATDPLTSENVSLPDPARLQAATDRLQRAQQQLK